MPVSTGSWLAVLSPSGAGGPFPELPDFTNRMEMPLDLFCLDSFLPAKHTGSSVGRVGTWGRPVKEERLGPDYVLRGEERVNLSRAPEGLRTGDKCK